MRHVAPFLLATLLLAAAPARADVVIYCSADEKICRGLVTLFTKETGIKAEMTRNPPAKPSPASAPKRTTRAATSGGPAPATPISRPPRKG